MDILRASGTSWSLGTPELAGQAGRPDQGGRSAPPAMAPTAEPARTPPQSDAGKAAKAAQDRGKLEEMVKQMQQEFGFKQTKIAFEVDSDSKEMLVKVLDRQSGEVLRQFPPEELLKIREAFQDLSRGLLLNTNA